MRLPNDHDPDAAATYAMICILVIFAVIAFVVVVRELRSKECAPCTQHAQ